MPDVPHGLTLERLPDLADARHTEARAFCLAVIKEFYGSDYRVDWHADLDSLAAGGAQSWYGTANRGAFWTLREAGGAIVAAVGLYRLGLKPRLVEAFAERYPKPDKVAQLVRLYVREDHRGRRIGRWFDDVVASQATGLGYETLYLHANAETAATLAFWRGRGYREIAAFGDSVHFDRTLSNRI
jgi:GNAT superfamily N-acetyltransferase